MELPKENIFKIHPLCQGKEDTVLWSCVEGHLGNVWVDNTENPCIAVVVAGDFCYLLGNMNEHFALVPDQAVLEKCRDKIIVTDDDFWISSIEKYYPALRTFSRYKLKFEPENIQRELLYDYIRAVEPYYQIKRQDESIYYKALDDGFTADFCCFFSSMEEFLLCLFDLVGSETLSILTTRDGSLQ